MKIDSFRPNYKPGDIIRISRWIIIYAGLQELMYEETWYSILTYAYFHERSKRLQVNYPAPTGGLVFLDDVRTSDVRSATNYEKEILYEAMEKSGYRWNPETMELEKNGRG